MVNVYYTCPLQVLSSYLPGSAPAGQGSTFSEAGALYGLGLIHAGQQHGESAKANVQYLLEQLRGAQNNETIQHGACLGLGLLCMGSANEGGCIRHCVTAVV